MRGPANDEWNPAFGGLSIRVFQLLRHAALLDVDRLRAMSDADLLGEPRLGPSALREIRLAVGRQE